MNPVQALLDDREERNLALKRDPACDAECVYDCEEEYIEGDGTGQLDCSECCH